jgi:hypothetical protein
VNSLQIRPTGAVIGHPANPRQPDRRAQILLFSPGRADMVAAAHIEAVAPR